MKGSKAITAVLCGCALVVALGLVLLTFEYDSPKLGNRLLELVEEPGQLEIRVSAFKLSPLRGLRLEGFEAMTMVDGGKLTASVDSVMLRHQVWPLLRGELVIDEAVLSKPHLELVASPDSTTAKNVPALAADSGGHADAEATPEDATIGLDVHVTELRITNGSLLVIAEGSASEEATVTRIAGLDLHLEEIELAGDRPELLVALTASGSMMAEELVTDSLNASNVSGRFTVAGGHLVIVDLELASDYGPMIVPELDLDLTKDPFTFDVVAEGQQLDFSSTLGALGGGLGDVAFELRTSGDLSETMGLEGGGKLVFTSGKIPESKILRGVQKLLPGVPLIGAEYEPFEVAFELRRSRVLFESFALLLDRSSLTGSGSVGLNLSLSLALISRFPRELLEDTDEIPNEILELFTDAEGMVSLPLIVAGQRDDPRASFDRSQWRNTVKERLRDEAENELARQLGRLFGGDKDEGR